MLKGYNFDLAARFVSDYKLPVSIISDVNVFEYELNLYEKEYQSLTKWNSLVENIEKYYELLEFFIEEKQKKCDHKDMKYIGHGSHYDYYKCDKCGFNEKY